MLKEAVKVGKCFHSKHAKKKDGITAGGNRTEILVKEQYKSIKYGENLPNFQGKSLCCMTT